MRKFIVISDQISADVAISFNSEKEAMEWLEAKGIDKREVRARYTMPAKDVHWM